MKIKNESEYEKASERADEIFDAKKGTPEEKELQELLKAIKEYEDDFVRMLRDKQLISQFYGQAFNFFRASDKPLDKCGAYFYLHCTLHFKCLHTHGQIHLLDDPHDVVHLVVLE